MAKGNLRSLLLALIYLGRVLTNALIILCLPPLLVYLLFFPHPLYLMVFAFFSHVITPLGLPYLVKKGEPFRIWSLGILIAFPLAWLLPAIVGCADPRYPASNMCTEERGMLLFPVFLAAVSTLVRWSSAKDFDIL